MTIFYISLSHSLLLLQQVAAKSAALLLLVFFSTPKKNLEVPVPSIELVRGLLFIPGFKVNLLSRAFALLQIINEKRNLKLV